jgi:hypothetical protein
MSGIRDGSPAPEGKLRRSIGPFQLTLYGLGSMLGSGIHGLIGQATGLAGNTVWLAFLVAMVAALLTALSYASRLGKNCASTDRGLAEAGDWHFWSGLPANDGQSGEGEASGGVVKERASLRQPSPGKVGGEAVDADNVEHAGKVVGERHEAPLAAHLVEASQQEVAVAGAAFERAERVFSQAGTAAHHPSGGLHPLPMAIEYVLMHPATDGARAGLGGDAALAQRAGIANRLAAHIPNLEPAAGILLEAFRRPQRLAG